jgi:hypothetical protein
MAEKRKGKRVEPRESFHTRFGIINPYGQFWTDDTFDSIESAERHVRAFWNGTDTDITRFSYVPVDIVISVSEFGGKQVEPTRFESKKVK